MEGTGEGAVWEQDIAKSKSRSYKKLTPESHGPSTGHPQTIDGIPHSHDHSHDQFGDHDHDHPHGGHHTAISTSRRNAENELNSPEARQFYNIPPTMDTEEASYLLRTILSFKYYKRHAFAMNHIRMQNFYALPEFHRVLLQPSFTQKLEAIDAAIERNAIIAKRIARLGEEMYLGGLEVQNWWSYHS